MTYSLTILRKAQNEMADLTPEAYVRVKTAAQHLADDPRPPGSKKLVGRTHASDKNIFDQTEHNHGEGWTGRKARLCVTKIALSRV